MDIEEKRLELEHKRLILEEEKNRRDTLFFNKHFGVIITAAVSLATVAVSGTQVWVAHINKNKELEATAVQKQRELDVADLTEKRRWRLDVAEFILEQKLSIFSKDPVEATNIRNVMLATFPLEITEKVFLKIEASSPEDQQSIWIEGQNAVDRASLATDEFRERKDTSEKLQTRLSQDEAKTITPEFIAKFVEDFKGPKRRALSDEIAAMYESNPKSVVKGLVDGILPNDDRWSYRVNIYIARTLESIKPSWEGSEDQIKSIRKLRDSSNYQNDKTFKARVEGALSNLPDK